MAGYTLKLSIYTITLKDGEKNDVPFSNLHKAIAGSNDMPKVELFSSVKDKFIHSFSERFVLNYNKTKGIAIKQINTIPTMNIIDGMMIGGLTGIEQEVYKTSSSEEKQDTITEDEVTALPYYFKIWMPYDSNVGIIMIQSYTETGVVSLVMDKIKHFIRSYNFFILSNPFVDEEYKERFKKYSIVDQLVLAKTHLSSEARGALNKSFADFEGLKVEIKLSGFNISIDEFWHQINAQKPLDIDLSEFEMRERENYDVIATYKDISGKQSKARLSKNLDILPTIILDSTLKEQGKEYPNYEKIQTYTNTILTKVKQEIGYEANEVE
ncbi:MAG: hypothetical protein FWD60_12720 [Candidatus Azobacteroides sp.]|nr:hypothetical protein [Candidatus Azobacteroides sp.]